MRIRDHIKRLWGDATDEERKALRKVERLGMHGARMRIVQAANNHSQMRVYTMRHIQEAVCLVRRQRLVDEATLVAAGFNARGKLRGGA